MTAIPTHRPKIGNRGSKIELPEPDSTHAPIDVPNSDLPSPISESAHADSAALAARLTAQWEIVKSSVREQLRFGALMLEARHFVTVSARGHGGRFGARGSGFKGWLAAYAPAIGRGAAYRLMEIAEGLVREFRLDPAIDLDALLRAAPGELDPALAATRARIDHAIEGKSQKQLLLQFGQGDGRSANIGGFRPNGLILRAWLAEHHPEHPEYQQVEIFSDLPPAVQKRFKAEGQRYGARLPKAQRDLLARQEAARTWNTHTVSLVHQWIEHAFWLESHDPDHLLALETALRDTATLIARHRKAQP